MLTLELFLVCGIFSVLYVSTVHSCKCAPDSFNIPRNEVIEVSYNWENTKDIYTGYIIGGYCKCYPSEDDLQHVQCISLSGSGGGRVNVVRENDYVCMQEGGVWSYGLLHCDDVIDKAVKDNVLVLDPASPKRVDVTDFPNCGFTNDYERAVKGEKCDLTHQPCFYNIKVLDVFKGNYKPGQEVSSPGPDVLTSCGQRGRVLEIGETYIVGIGFRCNTIQPWSTYKSFSNREVELLRNLKNKRDDVNHSNIPNAGDL